MKILPLFAFVLLCSSGALPAQNIAPAHGYVTAPISRASACAQRINSSCGAVSNEPQSVEGPKGFPTAGPPDGMIPSAGPPRAPFNLDFSPLNEQTPTRWAKQTMQSGQNTFTWHIHAGHATTKWEFFITKSTWSGATTTTPLRREDFDLTPFCTRVDGGTNPGNGTQQFSCNVPQRTGYHIILAVWTIADTANAFYQVIDADFGNSPPVDPPPAGDIYRMTTEEQLLTLDAKGVRLSELLRSYQGVQIVLPQANGWNYSTTLPTISAGAPAEGRFVEIVNNTVYKFYIKDASNIQRGEVDPGQTIRLTVVGNTWIPTTR